MSVMYIQKKSRYPKNLTLIVILTACCLFAFIIFSNEFERNKPIIEIEDNIFWNLKTKLDVNLSDDSGIKYYKFFYNNGSSKIELNSKILSGKNKNVTVSVSPPKFDLFTKSKTQSGYLLMEVIDNSKWNYLNGNVAKKKIKLTIDVSKPVAQVINNSYYINQGGSAVGVFKVKDDNLEDSYVLFNNETKFKLTPFYKDDYYISLIAWPIDYDEFDIVNLVAIDKAGNKKVTKVPFYIKKRTMKYRKININKKFIDDVSMHVIEQSDEVVPSNAEEIFIKQNRQIRRENIDFIRDLCFKNMSVGKVNDYRIDIFRRLKGSSKAAGFGERRLYLYENKNIDEQWHLGIDWASTRRAPVFTSNNGKVLYNDYLGIYGETIILDHGIGLMSLYAHTSSTNAQVGEYIEANSKIANTGSTGAALGDHLHFGMLVQGIEVNPLEWMDRNWIKINLEDIMKIAIKKIDNKI